MCWSRLLSWSCVNMATDPKQRFIGVFLHLHFRGRRILTEVLKDSGRCVGFTLPSIPLLIQIVQEDFIVVRAGNRVNLPYIREGLSEENSGRGRISETALRSTQTFPPRFPTSTRTPSTPSRISVPTIIPLPPRHWCLSAGGSGPT